MKKVLLAGIILLSIASCSTPAKAAYQCPMKCEAEKTYDKPGACPLCNMDLKEVK